MTRRLARALALWLIGLPVIRLQVIGYELLDKLMTDVELVCGPYVVSLREWER